MTRKGKPRKKWGKIGAPGSKKRKAWMRKVGRAAKREAAKVKEVEVGYAGAGVRVRRS